MFRSLLTLLLLAGLNPAGSPPAFDAAPFNEASLLTVQPVPVQKADTLAPFAAGKAVVLMDLGTGAVLFEKNADQRMPMASLTKIMTAVLILENHSLDEVVRVQSDFTALDGVKIWLRRGERMTVGDLLIGMLVPSGGDAAMALAEYHSGTVEQFVAAMNQKAVELHLLNTHFVNPIGLDADGHYSSARDLAILTKRALRFPDFRRIVRMSEATVTSVDGATKHAVASTNPLLKSYLDVEGVKTGTTDGAGNSVINLVRGPAGQEVLAVLLNSPDRFQENKSLMDWALRSFLW